MSVCSWCCSCCSFKMSNMSMMFKLSSLNCLAYQSCAVEDSGRQCRQCKIVPINIVQLKLEDSGRQCKIVPIICAVEDS